MKKRLFFHHGITALLLLSVAGCASPRIKPVDDELARQTSLAYRAFSEGRIDAAGTMYEQALDRAWAIYDLKAIADNSYNLAACLIEQQRAAKALNYLERSESMYEQMQQPVPAANWLLKARAAFSEGTRSQASDYADKALVASKRQKADVIQAQTYLLKAQWACDADDTIAARTAWQQAVDLNAGSKDDVLAALIADVKGQIDSRGGDYSNALSSYDTAITLYKKNAQYISMSACMERAAGVCLKTGDIEQATRRYIDTAQCLYAQSNYTSALQAVDNGMKEAATLNDDILMNKATQLFEKIRQKVAALTADQPREAHP